MQVDLMSQEAVDSTRIEAWMFGSMKLFSPECPGLSAIRDNASGRLDPIIALCIQNHGTGQSTEDDRQRQLMPGDLLMVGPTARNEFVTRGATTAIEIPFDEIELTVEIAKEAYIHLPASPLFPLVGHHLLALRADPDLVSSSAAPTEVGIATTHLVRASMATPVACGGSRRLVQTAHAGDARNRHR